MVSTGQVSHVWVVAFFLAFFPNRCQMTDCAFATFSYLGTCTSTCPESHIADTVARECREINSTEIHHDGYTVNATKYEAIAFVDDITMNIPGGSYLFTIEVIPVSLDINQVLEFSLSINGSGTESVDIQGAFGASNRMVILRTVNPLPLGSHLFTVGLKPFSLTLTGTFTELKREVELWILSPTQPCSSAPCSNGGTCSDVVITGLQTFSCNCTLGWTGPTCSDVDDIDFCAFQPCLNGGTCLDTRGGYSCQCVGTHTGPSGSNCTVGVDECQQTNNSYQKHCANSDGSSNCSCAPFYTGANCEILIPCSFNTSENGTTSSPTPSPPPPVVHMPVNVIIYFTVPAVLGVLVLLLLLLLLIILIVTAAFFVKKKSKVCQKNKIQNHSEEKRDMLTTSL